MTLQAYIQQRLNDRRILLMTHVIVGYPSLEANRRMLEIMAAADTDLVELQLPFSEPVADGPAFAQANQLALQAGMTVDAYFDFFERSAADFDFPHLMMGYYNSVYRMGHEAFCRRLSGVGGKGFILPDLPFEEYGDLFDHSAVFGLDPVMMMAPTNTPERLAAIGGHARGLVYCVARKGVTGRKTDLEAGVAALAKDFRQYTDRPLGLGFGLRRGEDIRRLHGLVEVAIVGSALLECWQSAGEQGYAELIAELAAART